MNALSKFREAKGLTQEQIAELLGTTKATVSRWESDKRRPDPAMAIEIESKLGIPREELRPDLFAIQNKSTTPKQNGKSNWDMAYGCMKGLIKYGEPPHSAFTEEELEELEKEWLANWDELLKK
jgi:transcriptional regulator with XRE-family HTH domain